MEENLTIISGGSNSTKCTGHGHILNHDIQAGKCFNDFVDRQKEHVLNEREAVNLRDETTDILAHCNPHNAVTNEETTHLVVGYVQSGKTMSFIGLTALAHDNGYRVVVYLAGTKLNLLEQTSSRLERDLAQSKAFKIHKDPTINEAEDIIGHLGLTDKPTILIPLLKHHTHIKKLTEIFKDEDFKNAMRGETVLIIDDEADQASLNSYGRSNSLTGDDETSTTYDSIMKMRAVLPGNTYVQYTATPQANILISMQDILSPKSHTLLTPGEGYIGGKLYFGMGEGGDLFGGALINMIPDGEVFSSKRNNLKKMPQSLRDALMLHILGVAIVVKWSDTGIDFLSMMVHPDVSTNDNKKFKTWIERELKQWRKLMDKPDGQEDKEDLMARFKNLYSTAVALYDDNERPTFDNLRPFIKDILNDKKVYLINSDKDADKEIKWHDYCMHILVGAEMLNRGFTIENLATTYMPRHTAGPSNADTIQQRCRFFGYKRKYIKSCLVFLPADSIIDYHEYVEHEEELRSMLASCDSLEEAEHQILLSPRLHPTRSNVLPANVVKTQLSGIRPMQAFESKETILHNNQLVRDFTESHKDDFSLNYAYGTPDRTHRGLRLKVEEAVEFLNNFRFKNYPDASRKSATIRYLRYLAENQEKPLKWVYLIQMAWNSNPRERSFDFESKRFAKNTILFAGPSSAADSSKYPGDTKIVENDSITIQLHHIKFKGGVEPGFPPTAYTLAINYPEEFAVSYCSNEEGKLDEEKNND